MVDKENIEAVQNDLEPTGEDNIEELELEAVEENSNNKLHNLRTKLKACEAEKMQHLEELQRAKADFLNARKRLDDEKVQQRERLINDHIEELLPLYDSFTMAMSNQAAWEAIDASWRSGVEGIFSQLKALLLSYGTTELTPIGETFDPEHHEAIGSTAVEDETQNHIILEVVQKGFTRKSGSKTVIVRPARVIVGEYKKS